LPAAHIPTEDCLQKKLRNIKDSDTAIMEKIEANNKFEGYQLKSYVTGELKDKLQEADKPLIKGHFFFLKK